VIEEVVNTVAGVNYAKILKKKFFTFSLPSEKSLLVDWGKISIFALCLFTRV